MKSWLDDRLYEGFSWICDECGQPFVSRDDAIDHWEKEHRKPAVKMPDGGLRYIFEEKVKPGWGGACDNCGKLMTAWGIFADREVGHTVILCDDCSDLLTCRTLAVHASMKKRDDGFKAWKVKDEDRKAVFAEENAEVIAYLRDKVESDRFQFELEVCDWFAAGEEKSGLQKPVFKGGFFASLLDQYEKRGTLSERQMASIRDTMTRNTTEVPEVGEKVTVGGKVLGYRFKADQYGQYAIITFRTKNNTDFVLKVGGTTRLKKDLKLVLDEEREIVLGVPDEVAVVGTVNWIDNGGKVHLTRCKLSEVI